LAGCGGSSGGGSSGSSASKPGAAKDQVTMQNLQFSPATLKVKVGQAVTWRNDEGVDHNVTAQKGASFHSDAFGQGKTYSFTPKKPGTIDYVCTLHPGMDGKLVVTK
jgi:plastocyanin